MTDPSDPKPPRIDTNEIRFEEETAQAIYGNKTAIPPAREWQKIIIGPQNTEPAAAHRVSFSMEASDIVAVGVLILALGAVLVAVIVSLGLVFGKVPTKEAAEIILGCVSGSAISGVVAALLGGKKRPKAGHAE
jgi:hypothetical protein